MKPPLLIIDDDESILKVLFEYFSAEYDVQVANSGGSGLSNFQKIVPVAVLLDMRMPDMTGLQVLEKIKEYEADVPIIILTAYGDIETAVKAMKLGADQFLTKPVDLQALDSILRKAVNTARLQRDYALLKAKYVHSKENFILPIPISRAATIMASNPDTTVLITGPTGSGKGVLAKLIHDESRRREGPFLEINCAGLSKELLESELFGHEKGAFTDAKSRKKGLMEVADRGTLFLDEIGEMPMPVQARILNAIETKTFRRIGGTISIEVDIRIIAATNCNLAEKVKKNEFREDLFYRLNVLPITLPPLSDRKEDIHLLASNFLSEFNDKLKRNITRFSKEALSLLTNYSWPGNIRELRNVIERAAILCYGETINAENLPVELREKKMEPGVDFDQNFELMTIDEAEKRLIMATLNHTDNNKAAAARILGINVTTLARKLKRYGISEL